MLALKTYRNIYSLKDEWTAITKRSSRPLSAYQSYQVNKALFKRIFFYGIQAKYVPMFCCIFEKQRPILIAPLCKYLGKREFSTFGQVNGFLQYDFIYDDCMTLQKLGECLKFLMHSLNIETLSLKNIPTGSLLYLYMMQAASKYPINFSKKEHTNIHFGTNYLSWFSSLSKHTRQNIRTAYNRVQADNMCMNCRLNFGKPLKQSTVNQLINIYCNRHLSRYNLKTSFAKKIYLKYLDYSTAYLQTHPDAFHAILYFNGEIAAFMSGIIEKNGTSAAIPRLSIVDKFSRYSPGMILINEVAKCFTDNLQIENLDLSDGAESYKLSAGGEVYYTYSFTLENEKRNILLMTNNSDGLYGFRQELLATLSEHNGIYVSTPDDGYFEELQAIGCRVIETPIDRRGLNPITDIKLFQQYRKLLRQIKPDMVITYTIKPNVYGGLACRLSDIPYVANITGLGTAFQKAGILRTVASALYKVALKKAKVVFFENSGNQQTLLEAHIVKKSQCCVLNGAGVNLDHYAFTEYPADNGEIRFLFTGRIMQEKGVDELFAVMERLHSEGIPCSLDVLGDYEEDYKAKIKQYEAAGWLRFHGYQKDVRPFIANCHCFVLPSWHEGMANTNLECAAMGRPLITSRIHGCMEAVIESKSGLLCEAKNADSLYETMKTFIQLPHENKSAMGIAGRRHMEDKFDKKNVVEATIHGLCL